MYSMMDGGAMYWGMGLVWLVVVADLVLIGAACVKYLFFDRRASGYAQSTVGAGPASIPDPPPREAPR